MPHHLLIQLQSDFLRTPPGIVAVIQFIKRVKKKKKMLSNMVKEINKTLMLSPEPQVL